MKQDKLAIIGLGYVGLPLAIEFGKVFETILSLWDLIILFFIDIESHQRTKEYNIINEEINLDERL